jgi:hypothetical protein
MKEKKNMRPLILLALVVGLLFCMAPASNAADDAPAIFETVTVGATAIGISDSVLHPTGQPERKFCVLTLATADIRWRPDGTDPSSTVGHVMKADGTLTISGIRNLTRWRAIRTGGSSGVLSVSCW